MEIGKVYDVSGVNNDTLGFQLNTCKITCHSFIDAGERH